MARRNTTVTASRPGADSAYSAASTTSSGLITQRTTVRMWAMFHSGTSSASGVVIAAPVLGMDRWSGRSSTGECPCVLPVLLIAVVVVVDGRLGPVVRQRVLAVAIAAAVTGGGALLGDLDGRVEIGRAHVRTPVTWPTRMPSSARKNKGKI